MIKLKKSKDIIPKKFVGQMEKTSKQKANGAKIQEINITWNRACREWGRSGGQARGFLGRPKKRFQ